MRASRIGLLTGLVLSLLATSPWSQTTAPAPERLSLEAAVATAVRNNRELKNAVLEVDKSENRLAAVKTERYPYFKVGLEQSYLLAPLDLLPKLHLPLRREQGDTPDLSEVEADRVLWAEALLDWLLVLLLAARFELLGGQVDPLLRLGGGKIDSVQHLLDLLGGHQLPR